MKRLVGVVAVMAVLGVIGAAGGADASSDAKRSRVVTLRHAPTGLTIRVPEGFGAPVPQGRLCAAEGWDVGELQPARDRGHALAAQRLALQGAWGAASSSVRETAVTGSGRS